MELIVALNEYNIIGDIEDGEPVLPWYIPADLKWFKQVTLGKTVVMGATTFKSLGMPNGLPGRTNVVMSSTLEPTQSIDVVGSWEELISKYGTDVVVIGGASLYDAAMERGLIDTLYITCIIAPDIEPSTTTTQTKTDFYALGLMGFPFLQDVRPQLLCIQHNTRFIVDDAFIVDADDTPVELDQVIITTLKRVK